MQIYNTLTRQKEEFKSIVKNEVRIYSCGPTVYDYPHIGNLRAFLFADTLRRTFEYLGYKVLNVMNITDVGHLVSDQDDGEDKMDKAAKKENKDPYEIARFYETEFKKDLKALNIETPWKMPRATEHIEAQIKLIEKLFENGYAYILDDGIYYDVSKFKKYGELSGQKPEEKQAGARVEIKSQKRNPADFSLWKFATGENQNHIMVWDSPWKNEAGISRGFPGWHIECSAMSMQYLGETFDIHTGGIDHIPVHHENEIAQSEGATGKPFVRYWMHNDFLRVDGGKMSKSLGNFYKLQDLKEKGFSAMDYRYFCLTAHYRSKLNFTWEALESAKNGLHKLKHKIQEILVNTQKEPSQNLNSIEKYQAQFQKALSDDLNTAQALAIVWDCVKDKTLSNHAKINLIQSFDQVLALDLLVPAKTNLIEIPENVLALAEQRQTARQAKDWKKSDDLRDQIASAGYQIKDAPDGFEITTLSN